MNSPELLQAGEMVGDYEVIDHLTNTPSSEIYRGVNEQTKMPVAIKLPIHNTHGGALTKERILHTKNADNPYVVNIDGHGVWHGRHYIATELQDEGTLEKIIDKNTAPSNTFRVDTIISELRKDVDTSTCNDDATIDFPALLEVKEVLRMHRCADRIKDLEDNNDLGSNNAVAIVTKAARELGHEIEIDSPLAKELTILLLKDMPTIEPGIDKASTMQYVNILKAVTKGVVMIHKNGVVHRDIKPGNVGLDHTGKPSILDFGIATTRIGQRDRVAGSPGNISPEGYRGFVSPANDNFALSAMAYTLLAGKMPWIAATENSLEAHHEAMYSTVPINPADINKHVPRSLGSVLMMGLALDPKIRASDVDLYNAFEAAAA